MYTLVYIGLMRFSQQKSVKKNASNIIVCCLLHFVYYKIEQYNFNVFLKKSKIFIKNAVHISINIYFGHHERNNYYCKCHKYE